MLRLLRFKSRRVDFIEAEAVGKRISLSRRGADIWELCYYFLFGGGCWEWFKVEVLRGRGSRERGDSGFQKLKGHHDEVVLVFRYSSTTTENSV